MKNRPYIMVVDDNQVMLQMLKRILELEGYGVAIVADGNSALALLQKCKPDLVILDIMLPGLDGYQVLSLIRQHSDVPVIMLTVRCEVASLHKALALGADDYVRKPFRTRELMARIQAKLRRAEVTVG
jgi:DNA-binding response OmpR family regulator